MPRLVWRVVLGLAVGLFAWCGWPTPYVYSTVTYHGTSILARTTRWGGITEVTTAQGWRPLSQVLSAPQP